MKTIELARKAASLGDKTGAIQTYVLAVTDEAGVEPSEKLEAAAYILQNGGNYKISYTCFRDLYNEGHFQDEILPLMSAVFYEPNESTLRNRYERNCKLLAKYPYIFRGDFPAFADLPIRFFPYDEHNSYIPFYRDTMLFGDFVNFDYPVVSRNFFKDLDKPILASDVFSQYELEYLNDNVRRSDYIGRENHIYLHYSSWEQFCAYLQVLNLRPLLKEEKMVFLIEDEIGQYPIDFKERFGLDYNQYAVKPIGLREVNRIIWHTQLSTHNGGDFFNEVFDAHPNLLPLTSVMFDSMEKAVAEWKKQLSVTKRSGEAKRDFLRQKGVNSWIIQEICNIQKPTDKDIFTAIYMSNKDITKFLDPASRIAPAVFFQPHFHNIVYRLEVDERDRAVLDSDENKILGKSRIFRGFKYIKTFTPMRRFTTSHAATVRFMYYSALEAARERAAGKAKKDEGITVVADAVTQRVLNRSFMIDWEDRLYKDSIVVRFEDGKLNPKATFTALAAFLDLPYTESMTYCSEAGKLDPHPETKGFDPAPVFKTYDDFVNNSERYYIEYFLRDAYAFYGYDFQYYDGQPVTVEQVNEWTQDFTTMDHYLRETWKYVYEDARISVNGVEAGQELQDQLHQQLLERQITAFHENRDKNSSVLMHGLRFLNRNGQPLRMMPMLEPDPALLEQPLYH